MKKTSLLTFLLIILLFSNVQAQKIDRVILSTNDNPNYYPFWKMVAPIWKKLGFLPTLAVIGSHDLPIDRSLGEVIFFEPIKGIPTSFQAQTIRLLLPAMFPDSCCLIADIDLFPLQKEYFQNSISHISDDQLIIYRDKAYPDQFKRFPMCYVAAKGSTFKEIFAIHKISDFRNIITKWHKLKLGWETDERVLYQAVYNWEHFTTRCTLLGHDVTNRIDKLDWKYDKYLLKKSHYIDALPPRPYSKHNKVIDRLIADMSQDAQ